MEGDDVGAINGGIESLTSASHKLAEMMYSKAGQAGPGPGPGAGAGTAGAGAGKGKDEDVVDADYEEVK